MEDGSGAQRRGAERTLRLCGSAGCLAVVVVACVYLGGQGRPRSALLQATRSDNYYVDAREAQHREERLEELGELQREAAEKRLRKKALMAQETRQAEDEDRMADKQLERYNDIYTAATPEEAAADAELPQHVQKAMSADAELDRFDAPMRPEPPAARRASAASTHTQNLASSQAGAPSVKRLVATATEELRGLEEKLRASSVMQEQRGSTQLRDILDSSMLELNGLSKRVGAVCVCLNPKPSTLNPNASARCVSVCVARMRAPTRTHTSREHTCSGYSN